ncbi:glycosyltransferase family 9 protein [Chitiniphilus purpureus]|uniref:Glycosyltransferase family 9 protein n=1 Tax=Chitiniphilus purpureus TaxID=2981137 RepID=A0ABY6DMC6_9NEIS|nr:glycosyltransferase family 9 protein [Chitiniphilus sp. CD1]UXY15363.1 glycosyltransferase family 9 protein [Chitiniphilus sp. CD1]
MSDSISAAPAKIAVLRANGLGDFIFALPALEALRHAYPAAEIVLLGLPWHAQLFESRPGPIDRVVVVPPYPGVRDTDPDTWPAPSSFFEAMQAERFDLALQLHGGGAHSNPFVRQLGAAFAVGLQAPGAPPLDRNVPYVWLQPEVMRYLEVVGHVGAAPVTFTPRLAVTPADRQALAGLLPALASDYVVLHPGAGDARRRWPPSRFAELGDALAALQLQVIVTGFRADEQALVEEVLDRMHAPAVAAWGSLALGPLVALLAGSRLVVSNDSGPLHLAGAVGAPTVGLYWIGNVVTAGAHYRGRHRVLTSWQMHCPECGQHCMREPCGHDTSFLLELDSATVTAEALALLAFLAEGQQPDAAPLAAA